MCVYVRACVELLFILFIVLAQIHAQTFALSPVNGDLEQAYDRDRMLVKIEQIEFVVCVCVCV